MASKSNSGVPAKKNRATSVWHTPQEQVALAKKILAYYSSGAYTLESCCLHYGVPQRTFHYWAVNIASITKLYKESQDKVTKAHRQSLRVRAANALEKLITGFQTVEVHEDGEAIRDEAGNVIGIKVKNVKRVKKRVAPNVTAVIFTLKSLDPEVYKDNKPAEQLEEQTFLISGKEIKF